MNRQRYLLPLLLGCLVGAAHAQVGKTDLAPGGGPVYSGPADQGSSSSGATEAPDAPPDLGRLYARAHLKLQRARRAKDKGDLKAATDALAAILAMPFPSHDKSRQFLGPIAANRAVLLKSQGKYREADEAIREGLAILDKPDVKKVYHVMLLHSLHGEVLEQLGRPKEAAAAHKRAAELELALDAEN